MTYAWYGHLKHLAHKPLIIAVLVSWLVALLEYSLQVPANRIGHQVLSIQQLKIIQEAIALLVFIPFSLFILNEKVTLNYIYAALCILAAVFFIFRE